jgi:PilZ domain-containing protein
MGEGRMSQGTHSTMLNVAVSSANLDSLATQIQGLIDDANTTPLKDERRARDRFPIPYTFRLTPLDENGEPIFEEETTVVGKDLSLIGIGFSHDQPLSGKRILVTLNHPKVGQFAVEAEVVWTRPTPLGLYESGCRLIRTVSGHIVRPKG